MFSAAIALQARGVGNNPDPVASVRCVNGDSRNNKRPCGVACAFQVRKHLVEAQCDVASNVFSKHPSGPEFFDKPQILRPEVAVIIRAFTLPGVTEWLARVSAANNVNWSNVRPLECPNIAVTGNVRPVLFQDALTKRVDFAERHGDEPACPLKTKGHAAQAREKIKHPQRFSTRPLERRGGRGHLR
jgi:hypothetical protein